MISSKRIQMGVILTAVLFLIAGILEMDAYARVGGGRSFGSRGARSYSMPSRTVSPSPAQPSPQMARQSQPLPAQQTPSMWRSLAYGALGGMVGGMLFSGLSHGFGDAGGFGGSGIGLIEILLIGLILYGIYRIFRRKQQEQTYSGAYARTGLDQTASQAAYGSYGPDQESYEGNQIDAGIAYIRQMDSTFDEKRFTDLCTDHFFRIQGAWINRDMAVVRGILTDEMYGILQGEADKLKADKKINKLDNIAVRTVDITEVWQESGMDFITLKFLANLVDYTVNESGELVDGSKTEPVKFEEYWTFTRPVGNNPWQLSAINQP